MIEQLRDEPIAGLEPLRVVVRAESTEVQANHVKCIVPAVFAELAAVAAIDEHLERLKGRSPDASHGPPPASEVYPDPLQELW